MRKVASILLLCLLTQSLQAAYVVKMPAMKVQPNGDTLYCFITGDEAFLRLHDANDYTIMLNPATGYYVYAVAGKDILYPTPYVAGTVNPATIAELRPGATISTVELRRLRTLRKEPYREGLKGFRPSEMKTSGENHGILNDLVIFIRFSDEDEISTPLHIIDSMFNDTVGVSLYNYFRAASYNKILIPTHFYPAPQDDSVRSYQDTNPRSYYMPYSNDNTNGYRNDNERATREFDLLERAVNYVNTYSPIPSSLDLDMNNDGYVDNICFIVKGTYTDWSELLWPHKWSIYDRTVTINGKVVYTFNLQLEGAGSSYFGTSTFCHEMSHTLGNPDLYHYNNYQNVHPAGTWDLMEYNLDPPQHTNALFKNIYGNWIDSIPVLRTPGTYTLHSISSPTNNAYAIPSGRSNEYYIVEYRNYDQPYEKAVPGKGLIIYRYNSQESYYSNMYFDDGINYNHLLWLFRPNSTADTESGNYAQAHFNASSGRSAFNITTDPHPYQCDGTPDTSLNIYNITDGDSTISFTLSFEPPRDMCPLYLETNVIDTSSATLHWLANSDSYEVVYYYGCTPQDTVRTSSRTITLTGLHTYTEYQWKVRGISGNTVGEWSDRAYFRTMAQPVDHIYVTTDGTGDGLSWETAMGNINEAVSMAALSVAPSGGRPDVWVKAGTYYGSTDDTASFTIRCGVNVYGGLNGNESPNFDVANHVNTSKSTLDGQYLNIVLCQKENFGYNDITTWQGFEIVNGIRGALLRENSILRHCDIHHNTPTEVDYKGAGIYCDGGRIQNCNIYHNGNAICWAGGAYITNGRMEDCTITNNQGAWGGGLFCDNNCNITNCNISNNLAYHEAGGIYSNNGTFCGLLVANNRAMENGGGIYADGRNAYGLSGGTYHNCTVVDNHADDRAGGIFLEGSGGTYKNCIVWGNHANGIPNQLYANANGGRFSFSAIQGGRSGFDNIDLEADNNGTDSSKYYVRFIAPEEGNYRLLCASACVDTGVNGVANWNYDLDGNPRIRGTRVDLGCYEADTVDHIAVPHIGEVASLIVYPNPSHGVVNIKGGEVNQIEVFDVLGRRVALYGKEQQIDISTLPHGIYTLLLHTHQSVAISKVLLQ